MSTTERRTERANEAARIVIGGAPDQPYVRPTGSAHEDTLTVASSSGTRVGATERPSERVPQRIIIRTPANRFDIDVNEIPEGMDYAWKVKRVNGQEAREKIIEWRQNGWREVPAGRHPSFTMAPADSQEEIERGGLVLCERPLEISKMSRAMERQAATDQIRTQEERIAGRARQTQSQRATKLNTAFEAISDDV